MIPKLFVPMIFVSLFAILALALQPSAARQEYPAIGGSGDTQAPSECRHGHYVIGFKGRVGDWIDQISFECGALQPDGSLIPDPPGQAFGGNGGSPAEITCPPRSVMNKFLIKSTEDDRMVGAVEALCVDVKSGAVTDTIRFGGTLPVPTHSIFDVGDKPNHIQNQECRAGEALTGFQVNYGKHVNALGAICDTLHLPAPPPSSVVLAPTTPPQPPAVLKRTGHGRPRTPDGPGPFVGVWNTQTSQHAHFRVTFSVSNGVLVGKFENLDNSPQYNGTLTQKPGTEIKDGNLAYTYVQPATKGSGTGLFMIVDGDTLVGQIVTNDNPPLKVPWHGNKVGAPPAGAR
jgi:hypothetical protein